MRTFFSVGVPAFSSVVFASSAAAAQELDAEGVVQIARVIRWSGVVTSLFVVVAVWFGLRVTRDFVLRLSQRFPARRLLLQKTSTVLQFASYVITAVVVVALSIRLEDSILAVIGGTLAVSIGFAIRDVVASFIAGIIIMVDGPFQVGDRVQFGGEYGDITAIGLRSVRLQTLGDNTVTIPNNKFITDITSNGNFGALDMQVAMDFYIGLDQDVDEAQSILKEAALTSRYVHLPKPVPVLVNQVVEANFIALRLRLKAYVLDTRFEKRFETDINLKVHRAFRERAIAPPVILHRNPN
ncbi:MAG: mechanosensitive ion channel domain-containing protein [Myxococcota bacterium]